jgi:hypothetical protein
MRLIETGERDISRCNNFPDYFLRASYSWFLISQGMIQCLERGARDKIRPHLGDALFHLYPFLVGSTEDSFSFCDLEKRHSREKSFEDLLHDINRRLRGLSNVCDKSHVLKIISDISNKYSENGLSLSHFLSYYPDEHQGNPSNDPKDAQFLEFSDRAPIHRVPQYDIETQFMAPQEELEFHPRISPQKWRRGSVDSQGQVLGHSRSREGRASEGLARPLDSSRLAAEMTVLYSHLFIRGLSWSTLHPDHISDIIRE